MEPDLRDTLVVVNRQAGGVTDELVEEVLERCATRGSSVRRVEEDAGLLCDQVEAIAGDGQIDAVVSVGGDGTVREVAEGLARRPAAERPPLLVVPAGSGNSLYALLWGETPWTEALERSLAGGAGRRRLDLIHLREAERIAILGVNVGLVAQVAEAVERVKAEGEGEGSAEDRYWAAFGEALADLRPFRGRVEVDGRRLHDGVASLITVGGVRSFGRGVFKLLPRSVADDGLLDACLVETDSAEEIARLAALVPTGAHLDQPGVRYEQGRQVTIERVDGLPLAVEHDGDPCRLGSRLTLNVLPAAIPFCAGASSATERG